MPRPPGKKAVPEGMFVRIWNSSPSAKAAAAILGLAHVSARCRAVRLRKRGVPLKLFPPGNDAAREVG